jgi:diguanylate cyclase (GGDEF)-like protein
MKILLAEDDPVSRLLMRRILEKFGYEVIVAEDGRRAAEILSQPDGPRLALVDWMMPELDGISLCREVRSHQTDDSYIYILLLTSKQNSEDVVIGLEAGADDYITKPCQPAELRARLHTGRRILSLEQNLIEAREEMRFRATRDALTMLWNRSSILSLTRDELQRSARDRTPLSILLCDVDHFKSINDNYGHLIGDLVLQELSNRLTSAVRNYDAVGRYGGEEFLILLSDCSQADVEARCEDIRIAVGSAPIKTTDGTVKASISIGAVTCGYADANLPIDRILARADRALYRAKAEGRNRTVLAGPFIAA